MTNWEQKFVRFAAERWVFQGSDPHDYNPRVMLLSFGEDFLSPFLEDHKHFGSLYSGYIGGRKVGYMRVPPGTVILEGVMRSLALTRVETVIGLGTCGALQEEINCGDIVVPESSKAGDCLSMHYGYEYEESIPADEGLSTSLADFLKGNGLPVHQGPIVTTGAVFRETDELISSWNSDGYIGVELEASSLFALAGFMGLRAAMALLVTDSPVRNETSFVLRGKEGEAFIDGMVKYIRSPHLP